MTELIVAALVYILRAILPHRLVADRMHLQNPTVADIQSVVMCYWPISTLQYSYHHYDTTCWGSLVFRSGLIQNLCIISDNIHRNINGSYITISVMLALCSFCARGCLFSKLLQFYIIHLDKIEDLLYR